jgi:predicted amidohydrolase YtcJ
MSSRLLRGQVSEIGHAGRRADAVWIKDGKIEAVGGDEVAALAQQHGAVLEDYGSRHISPGFVDPHAHVEVGSVALANHVDLRVPKVTCIDEVLQALSDHTDSSSNWILAQANLFWDLKLRDGRYPTRQELDQVSSSQPIAIRAGGHYSVLNTRALEISGIAEFRGSEGMMGHALIHRDEHGQPTGLVGELDAVLPLPNPTGPELEDTLLQGIGQLFTRYGVTTVGEISETRHGVSALRALAERDALHLRASLYLWVPGAFSLEEACGLPLEWGGPHDDMVRLQGLKVFADGGFSSRNAATLTPYREDVAHSHGSTGHINLSRDRLAAILRAATAANLQLAIHTNGERAQREATDAVVDAFGEAPAGRLRTRLEHAGNYVTSAETIESWQRAGIQISPQPAFLYNFDDFLPEYLGAPGERGRHPFRTLLAAGVRLAGSSDLHLGSELEQTNPLFGVWNCVKRESFLGNDIEVDERIDVAAALEMFTINAAALLGREDELGSITAGKLADIAILERDPATVPVDDLRTLATDEVIVGGRTVHRREAAAAPLRA